MLVFSLIWYECLKGCKSRGIKLCGALAAAGLIATRCSKDLPPHQREKYAVVTLNDCRSLLDPPLTSHHLGKFNSPSLFWTRSYIAPLALRFFNFLCILRTTDTSVFQKSIKSHYVRVSYMCLVFISMFLN